MSNIIQFRELERARREDSDVVIVYEGIALNTLFAYLYLNSTTYTLVWAGLNNFHFDARQPYIFVEHQFSHLPPSAIDRLDLVLPKRRPHSEAMGRMLHFYFNKAVANLILTDEMNQSLVEYDLLDNNEHRHEYLENSRKPEFTSRIRFARYDSEIITKISKFNCCFTAEGPHSADTEGWEFAINLPRNLLLEERTLKWIVRNHHDTGLLHHLDFKKSQDALREILNPQIESVFSEEIS
jgi:hypothetical protein